MKTRHTFLDGTAKRTTQVLSAGIAEFAGATGTNWDAVGAAAGFAKSTTISSPFNGDPTSATVDWGYSTLFTSGTAAGGGYLITHAAPGTFGTGMTTVSVYVRRATTGTPARQCTINLQGATGPLEHSVTFSRSAVGDRWAVSNEVGGAVGRVDPVYLPVNLTMATTDDMWCKLTLCFAVGWLDSAGVASGAATGHSYNVILMGEATTTSRTIEFWGCQVNQATTPTALTDHTGLSNFVVNKYLPPEYMVGLGRKIHNGVAPNANGSYHPLLREGILDEVQSATFSVWALGTTPDIGVKLWGTANDSCPWESLSTTVEGDFVSAAFPVDTNAVTVIRPKMRCCITELTTTTSTLGAVLF